MESFLRATLQNPSQAVNQLAPTSDLQRQIGQNFLTSLQDPSAALQNATQQVTQAFLPAFQRNLADSTATLQQSGPRFAQSTRRGVQDLQQRSLQDFNLFASQAAQQLLQQQLQNRAAAGQFALGSRGQNLQSVLGLLQSGFQAGGASTPGVLEQNPGFLQGTLLPILGTATQIGLAASGNPAAAASTGGFTAQPGSAVQGVGGRTSFRGSI